MDGAQLLLLLSHLFHNRLSQRMEHINKAANVVYKDRMEEGRELFLFCGFCWSMCALEHLSGDDPKYWDGVG